MTWLFRILSVRTVLAVTTAFLGWQTFVFLRPRPEARAAEEVAAMRAAAELVADRLRSAGVGESRIGVAHLGGDPGGTATAILKETLSRQPGWSVEERPVIQRLLADIARAVAEATSVEEVLHAGQQVGLDTVLAGRVLGVGATNGTGWAEMYILAHDVRQGRTILRDTIRAEWRPTFADRASRWLAGIPAAGRFALWLCVVLGLPWVTRFATARVLERKSNLASFLLVLGYTVAGLLLAAVLTAFQLVGGGQWLRFLGALVFCAGYNFWACERIAASEKA